METAAAVLTTTIRSAASHVSLHCPAAAPPSAVPRRLRQPCGGRIRALPSAEVISEILSPKLVPGSPSDTGDVSSLVPVSALMLLFYFVSNWVVPELLMKRLKEPNPDDDEPSAVSSAAAAASMSDGGGADDAGSPRKIRLKVKKKKNGKATIVKV